MARMLAGLTSGGGSSASSASSWVSAQSSTWDVLAMTLVIGSVGFAAWLWECEGWLVPWWSRFWSLGSRFDSSLCRGCFRSGVLPFDSEFWGASGRGERGGGGTAQGPSRVLVDELILRFSIMRRVDSMIEGRILV